MKKDLPKIYDPKSVEESTYALWEKSGYFNPDNLEGEPHSIMMPPPNVTGVLHLGHSLENSIMDAMARYQRMQGKKVLLLPGTDHAAVATQAKVEKNLIKKGIKNPREELGREKLLQEIRNYAESSKSTILSQIKKMGTSCDWSRLAYTFDEKRNQAVGEMFKMMYEDGLIYRGYRVVNWSVKGQSTCSDDELDHIERTSKIYTFRYSKDFPISIATTRPETKLGDTAVAVNPQDERYKNFIGQEYTVDVGAKSPLKIKIIADEGVDPTYGTGALGVTPAHSIIDFEICEKQKQKGNPLEIKQVIDKNGLMTSEAGKNYEGLTVDEARKKFVSWLNKEGLIEKEEEISQSVGVSDRFGDIVEAIPMTQWFIDVNKKIPHKEKSLKELMREAITIGHNNKKEQKIKITPERFEKSYLGWIDNLRDWCISRQIWWGHRIPIWYKNGETVFSIEKPEGEGWHQDPDTLDTWFSSGLWTFSTLGWPTSNKTTPGKPEKSGDLETFHPTSWMQMGYEILFFWMARMILMSTYALDEIPFKNVYIHGMLRDEKGQKFSKSLGNSMDPLDMIKKYGCDALRLSLLIGVSPGNDSRFYEEKVENSRNFINKLWNISRYIVQNTEETNATTENLTIADKWILGELERISKEISGDFEKYQFSQAAEKLKEFTWNQFADWYLEVAKFEENKTEKSWILHHSLETILKLWHPFIPFVTEKIWEQLGNERLLMIESWPKIETKELDVKKIEENRAAFELIRDVIVSIRNGRLENNIDPAKKIKVIIDINKQEIFHGMDTQKIIQNQQSIIKGMRTGVEELEVISTGEKIIGAISRTVGGINIFIPLEGLIDKNKEKDKAKKKIGELEKYIAGLKKRLSNETFIQKAPKEVINQQKQSLIKAETEIQEIRKRLENLQK